MESSCAARIWGSTLLRAAESSSNLNLEDNEAVIELECTPVAQCCHPLREDSADDRAKRRRTPAATGSWSRFIQPGGDTGVEPKQDVDITDGKRANQITFVGFGQPTFELWMTSIRRNRTNRPP